MLLPLPSQPVVPPVDRDMLPSQRRQFALTHRTCVFGAPRRADGRAMSIVYYVPTDADELLVSTMAARGKARSVARDPKVSLCILDETWPFSSLAESARAAVAKMAADEERIVLRCRPYETFAQPPRHLHRNDQAEKITHWVSATVPWDADDPS